MTDRVVVVRRTVRRRSYVPFGGVGRVVVSGAMLVTGLWAEHHYDFFGDVPYVLGVGCQPEQPHGLDGMMADVGVALERVSSGPPSPREVSGFLAGVGTEVGEAVGAFRAGYATGHIPLAPLLPEPSRPQTVTTTGTGVDLAAQAAAAAGWTGADLVTAVAVAAPESGYDPAAENPSSTAKGMWQTMMSLHAHRYGEGESWADPFANARAAYSIWQDQGWGAWVGYTSGAYKAALPEAQAAVARLGAVQPVSGCAPCVPSTEGGMQTVGFGASEVVWPVPGRRTSTYPGHDGVDINRGSGSDDLGDPIRSAVAGEVTAAGFGHGYGQAVFITGTGAHEGWRFRYGHTSRLHVRAGDVVAAGQVIGEVGDTGRSSAPHLHFTAIPPGESEGTYEGSLGFLDGSVTAPASCLTPTSDTGGLRVGTFNVLGSNHRPGDWQRRIDATARLLDERRVSLVGFQELQRDQAARFARLASGWSSWHPGEDTRRTVAWRSDTWAMLGTDTVRVPHLGGDVEPMPLVHLRHASGVDVWVLNVHNVPQRGGDRVRAEQVRRELAAIRGLSPVLVVGDMNARADFARAARAAGLETSGGNGIDWIAGRGVTFTGHDRTRTTASDHALVTADVTWVDVTAL